MVSRQSNIVAAILACLSLSCADAAILDLARYGLSIDGTVAFPLGGDPVPPQVNIAGFDTSSGLGVIDLMLAGAGPHTVVGFFDHEIDQAVNTFFNEIGSAVGTPAAGQTWEIDTPGTARLGPGGDPAPGPYVGDIDINLVSSDPLGSFLDGTGFQSLCDPTIAGDVARCDTPEDFTAAVTGSLVPLSAYETPVRDDVALAMGWSFALAENETAYLRFLLSEVVPGSGFYLRQLDPDSDASVYLASALRVVATPVAPTAPLMLLGLLAWRVAVRRLRPPESPFTPSVL